MQRRRRARIQSEEEEPRIHAMKKRQSKHIEMQFFAQKEALPESAQCLQAKSVAKCHTMVQKIHSSNSMQIQ
jgi:hypothetical protein